MSCMSDLWKVIEFENKDYLNIHKVTNVHKYGFKWAFKKPFKFLPLLYKLFEWKKKQNAWIIAH